MCVCVCVLAMVRAKGKPAIGVWDRVDAQSPTRLFFFKVVRSILSNTHRKKHDLEGTSFFSLFFFSLLTEQS